MFFYIFIFYVFLHFYFLCFFYIFIFYVFLHFYFLCFFTFLFSMIFYIKSAPFSKQNPIRFPQYFSKKHIFDEKSAFLSKKIQKNHNHISFNSAVYFYSIKKKRKKEKKFLFLASHYLYFLVYFY